jgi:hypothetical protein
MIENGNTGVSRKVALAIAKALGLDERETLERAGFSTGLKEDVTNNQAWLEFQTLSPEAQEVVLEHIRALKKLSGGSSTPSKKKS